MADVGILASLQDHFAEFRHSSGVLAANSARIRELEASVIQLTADNHGLHTSVTKAVRDAAVALNKEEQATKALAAFLKQLAPIGIGQRDDGTLGFSANWKTVLETLQGAAPQDSSGKRNILQALSLLAEKMKEASAKRATKNINLDQIEVINLADDSPTAGPSQQI